MRKIARTGVLVLALAFVGLVESAASDARAAEPMIGVGEVTVGASSADVDDGTLRAMVEDALGTIDPAKLPRGRAALLSLSVVRLESKAPRALEPVPFEMSCLVSATLRDRSRGAIFAVLEGSARGSSPDGPARDRDAPRRRRALARAILHAAVTSAVARVPEAMRGRVR